MDGRKMSYIIRVTTEDGKGKMHDWRQGIQIADDLQEYHNKHLQLMLELTVCETTIWDE